MPPSLLLPRWRRLGRGPTVFVVGPACHGPLLYNRARAQAGIRPSDTALIQKICPSRPCSRQIFASLHVCAKTIPRRTREDQIDKDFRPILSDFILKTNKVKPGRLEYNRWMTPHPQAPSGFLILQRSGCIFSFWTVSFQKTGRPSRLRS